MNPSIRNFKNIPRQAGVSLLEVLVALFVLAVGLLGVIALQAETIKLNQQAYGSTQAIFAANDAAERMRANMMALTEDDPSTLTVDKVFPDLSDWKTNVAKHVPGGIGEVVRVVPADTEYKITITYKFDVLDNQNLAANAETFEYVLFTRL